MSMCILPRERGGTNDFWNLVPVDRDVHQQQFSPWWEPPYVRMHMESIKQLVSQFRSIRSYHPPGLPIPQEQRCVVLPYLEWDPDHVQQVLSIVLPADLRALWSETCGLVLFEDITFGQWGLVVWSPDTTCTRHLRKVLQRKPGAFLPGDLVIGEFLGDSDLVVIRCDPSEPDVGSVMVAPPGYTHADWYRPAQSLTEFLGKFLQSNGGKFWEDSGERSTDARVQPGP